jgi:MFS family permease
MAMISWADLFRVGLGNYVTSSLLPYLERLAAEDVSLEPLLSDALQLSPPASGQTTEMADTRSNVAHDKKVASVEADDVPSNEISRGPSPDGFVTEEKVKVPWYAYIWDYEPGRSKEETAFVQQLDFYVLLILSLGYFIKNLDQTNISNAYVSGMKEDLQMNKNELNMIDVAWTCGYVIGQVPSQIILTKVRPSIWIPSCELVWTMLTFCLAAVTTSNHVIAIRFFVGLLESIFYPAAHMILGSWYKPSELAKRACIFHASSAAASMFSGYLQAGVYKGMNGLHGLPGWKWLFIMDGIISLVVAIAGLWLIPDLPENSRAFYLSKDQIALAVKRMDDVGRAPRSKLGWSAFKRIFGRWHVYFLTVLYIIFINAVSAIMCARISRAGKLTYLTATLRQRSALQSLAQVYRQILRRADQHHPNLTISRPARSHNPLRYLL